MKKLFAIVVLCLAFADFCIAQPAANPAPPLSDAGKDSGSGSDKFNLDFKGGTVHQLVDAISAARGKLVNVYIPADAQRISFPPVKAQETDLKSLLVAVSLGGRARFEGGSGPMRFAFIPATEKGLDFWYLAIEGVAPDGSSFQLRDQASRELESRVYLLTPYLDAGISVDDITTAIRTAWKMFDRENTKANLSYHRETKLLIAVAPNEELQAIDQVLGALQQGIHPKKGQLPVTVAPATAEKAPSPKN